MQKFAPHFLLCDGPHHLTYVSPSIEVITKAHSIPLPCQTSGRTVWWHQDVSAPSLVDIHTPVSEPNWCTPHSPTACPRAEPSATVCSCEPPVPWLAGPSPEETWASHKLSCTQHCSILCCIETHLDIVLYIFRIRLLLTLSRICYWLSVMAKYR